MLIEVQAEKAERYIGPYHHQHNPQIADGLTAFFDHLRENGIPFSILQTRRFTVEGNFVLLHSEGQIGGRTRAFADLFRVENGKILERWDAAQAAPDEMAHGNGIFWRSAVRRGWPRGGAGPFMHAP